MNVRGVGACVVLGARCVVYGWYVWIGDDWDWGLGLSFWSVYIVAVQ